MCRGGEACVYCAGRGQGGHVVPVACMVAIAPCLSNPFWATEGHQAGQARREGAEWRWTRHKAA
eukprot:364849-Chlamydomonas_euryale.AAC.13